MRRLSPGAPWPAAAVGLCCLAWLALTAGWRPLTMPDEGRYVGVAWEMLRSGNWTVPTLDGLPFFHKPPLLYWFTAASLAVFGPNEWAARLGPVLAASASAWGLFLFVRRWVDEASARLSLLVLLTMPMFFIGAQFTNHDMLVAGCIGVTVVLAAHATLAAEIGQPHRWPLLGAFVFAALGVLAKGLIGFVLPVMMIFTWVIATRRPKALLHLVWPPGLIAFALVAAPWFVAMQRHFDSFFHYFFVVQHFQRFSAGGFNNAQPFFFFVPVVLLLSLPWSVWIYRAVRLSWSRGESAHERARRDVRWLMWAWALVVIVFFSIPQSKLVGYVLPALPPLAFLLADAVLAGRAGRPVDGPEPRWLSFLVMGAGVLCVGVAVAAAFFPRNSVKLAARDALLRMNPGEPVVMLDRYAYDAAFYLRLAHPAYVVEDWTAARRRGGDNWRMELLDAGDFDPALAARVLVGADHLPKLLCRPTGTWIIGDSKAESRYPWLARAEAVSGQEDVADGTAEPAKTRRGKRANDLAIWRFSGSPASDPHCLETPTSGSPETLPPPPSPAPTSEASRSGPRSSAAPARKPIG
ncbi:glycosyltransferase family 39 protein [soil metagenome]